MLGFRVQGSSDHKAKPLMGASQNEEYLGTFKGDIGIYNRVYRIIKGQGIRV